ncbi:GIY-YIG nuclease family protein [Microbulbifer thermotolerans]|uniref:hypothetical protein n=1 Tax=Microbulbifer thermotolerans TaxID=252514 RepID=UPI00224B6435|nr:hypothetical protein [Microbulbifer thermotolerans]MCX2780367.1 hypothetical protein [Microbulbifer thermotolerans]MCX2805961.1 hypothetical protein [Microbulbifer thermotolerans]MCX2840285.1 hypothetical protein [Microbulbifer thermotolerans]
MIVFTLVNERTDEVWVGTTREGVSPEARFKQFQEALALGIDHPFYEELKTFGPDAFSVNMFAAAEDPAELKMYLEEALETYGGKSLAGIKTVRPGTTNASLTPKPKSRSASTAARKSATQGKSRAGTKPIKEKLSSGRTGSAAKERRIKEAIEAEKAAIAAAKAKQAAEEAAEMRAIMARLDARGSTLRKR